MKPIESRKRVSAVWKAATTAIVLAASIGAPAVHAQDVARKMSAEEVKAQLEGDTSRPSRDLWKGPDYLVMSSHRASPGEAEVHRTQNDLFVVLAGKAAVTVGGQVQGDRETAPNERRGGVIAGAQVFQLAAGDLLWIPAGEPHQVVPQGPEGFRYLVVKTTGKPAAAGK